MAIENKAFSSIFDAIGAVANNSRHETPVEKTAQDFRPTTPVNRSTSEPSLVDREKNASSASDAFMSGLLDLAGRR